MYWLVMQNLPDADDSMEKMSINVIINEADCMYSDICYSYWRLNEIGEFEKKVNDIAKEAGLSDNEILKIVKKHSKAYSNNIICVGCGKPFRLETRTSLKSLSASNSWTCSECKIIELHAISEAKRVLVKTYYERQIKYPVVIEKLGVRLAVFLLAFLKFCCDESMTHINEYSMNKTDLLSPNINYDFKIIEELYRAGVLAIDPESNMEAISTIEDEKCSFILTQVKWRVPLESTFSSLASFYEALDDLVRSRSLMETSTEN